MGGFEGNGRQRVVNVEDAGRLIVLEHKQLDSSAETKIYIYNNPKVILPEALTGAQIPLHKFVVTSNTPAILGRLACGKLEISDPPLMTIRK